MSFDPTAYEHLSNLITTSPFKGVKFYDVAPLMADPEGFNDAAEALDELCWDLIDSCADEFPTEQGFKIASPEARGFVFGAAIASLNSTGIVMLRKPDKLPEVAATVDFGKEYGQDSLQAPIGAIQEGDRVVIVDDLIATGGTPAAAAKLVEMAGGKVLGIVALIELEGLGARKHLESLGYQVLSVLKFKADEEAIAAQAEEAAAQAEETAAAQTE